MELSLLTGVKIFLTIFDEEDAKLIQYQSDSVEVFKDINTKKIQSEEKYQNIDVSIFGRNSCGYGIRLIIKLRMGISKVINIMCHE